MKSLDSVNTIQCVCPIFDGLIGPAHINKEITVKDCLTKFQWRSHNSLYLTALNRVVKNVYNTNLVAKTLKLNLILFSLELILWIKNYKVACILFGTPLVPLIALLCFQVTQETQGCSCLCQNRISDLGRVRPQHDLVICAWGCVGPLDGLPDVPRQIVCQDQHQNERQIQQNDSKRKRGFIRKAERASQGQRSHLHRKQFIHVI